MAAQALVETAIIIPVLLIMMLGVFEVGWLIRSFLVMDNVTREAARFATKANTLNLEEQDPTSIGFLDVVSHSNAALAKQLPLDYGETGWIVISVVAIKTSWPCDRTERNVKVEFMDGSTVITAVEHIDAFQSPTYTVKSVDAWVNCNCMAANFQPFTPTVVMQPDTHPYLKYAVPSTATTRLDYELFANELQLATEQTDCLVMHNSEVTEPSINIAVIVEIEYDHRQLLRFFPWVDPIEVYSRAVMRKVVSRELNQ